VSAGGSPERVDPPGRPHRPWLLYGAYGFTGRLLAEEAVARGHRPILAGRDRDRVEALARELGLESRSFALDDPMALRRGLEGVGLVLLAAGPFVHTWRPVVEACLEGGVHYLDITGEPVVLEAIYGRDAEARARGVVLLPGVGMDVVPTDAAAALAVARVPGANRLELALRSGGSASGGTLRTVLEHLPAGLVVRREDRLVPARPGAREFRRTVDFGPGEIGGIRPVAPYTWGDLASAPRTTGVPHVTFYKASSPTMVRVLPVVLPLLRALAGVGPLRRWAQGRVGARGEASPSDLRRSARTRIWARASRWGRDGEEAAQEVVLEAGEGYAFTALAGIRSVEAVLERTASGAPEPLRGAVTPAGAFGAEWVLGLPGTRRV
jgi:short subunit dehydrogenase-like uncharacterized protein